MVRCPACGEQNADRARFCQACGAELAIVPASREERKLVSILFVDLVGFTARSDQADPEDVRDTLQPYYARVKQEIERKGGAVEKFIGDAVMAVFGAPVAHGEDAERAVRTGLRVLDAIEELNRDHPGLDLTVRAAVNTGEAVVAVSRQEAGEPLALGDVVNTASRLQAAAPPGRLIVGAETYRATRHAIRYQELAPIHAKGKREPLKAWLAVGPLRVPGEPSGPRSSMVDRDRELATLKEVWERTASERRPHLVTVVGAPGVGKTRLAREFVSSVGAAGLTVRGRCLPYEEQTGYRAFKEQVRQLAGIFEMDPPSAAREKLSRTVAAHLPVQEAPEMVRYLSLLLGLGVDSPFLGGDALPLFFAARRFVEGLTHDRPALWIFEDIHWAGSSQLDLLEHLASHVRDTPAVFLTLARPELFDVRPEWGKGLPATTTIRLEPLPAADSSAIATRLLEGFADPTVVGRVVDASEGNPLFIEELAASVTEGADVTGKLPTTVRAAIASRIDALPPEPRTVLLNASVIGRTFWRGVLAATADIEHLDDSLRILEERDLIHRESLSQLEGDIEVSFKHMLVRETAYTTLPRSIRKERHASIARYLEGEVGEHAEHLSGVLAYHWRQAGEFAKALEYLLTAAERARQGWAKEEAVNLYSEALELVDDPHERVRIRARRGLALVALRDFDGAAAELAEVAPGLSGRDELEALLGWGRATFWNEQVEETMALAERSLELAQRLDEREMLGPALGLLSQTYAQRGEEGDFDRALELGDRALAAWVPGTRPADLAEHQGLHALNHYWTGEYERAAELARNAREIGGDAHSAEALLRGGAEEGLTLVAGGRHEDAIALFEETIARARELDDVGGTAYVLNCSTLALRDLLDFAEARRRNEEAVELWRRRGYAFGTMQGQIDLLFTDLLEGDVSSAERAWPALWERARDGTAWHRWLGAGRLAAARAQIALEADDPATAAERALAAIELARPVHRRKYEAIARTILGAALLKQGRAVDAVAELRTAVALAERFGHPPQRWLARAALGRALAAVGDDDGAVLAFREAAARIRAFAATLTPEHAKPLLDAEPVREILGTAG